MSKLLSAELTRLFKSLSFKISMLFMIFTGILAVYSRWRSIRKYPEFYEGDITWHTADDFLFMGAIYIIVVSAAFLGIFIGTEYSNQTIRNKLIAGHSRIAIYLSKLIVCSLTGILMNLTWILTVWIAGNLVLMDIQTPFSDILMFAAFTSLSLTALTAVYLSISMSVRSKSAGSVTLLLLSFGLLITAMIINDRLTTPEFVEDTTTSIVSETGETIDETTTYIPNPYYPTGTKRRIYEILYDILPTCQLYRASNKEKDGMGLMSLYAAGTLILFTAAGASSFRKKDIK